MTQRGGNAPAVQAVSIAVSVNRREYRLSVRPWWTAAEVLRDMLALPGTKIGCDIGECGACTVLVDGEPLLACLLLAPELDGRRVLTIEGLAEGDLTPLQRAFLDEAASQCGFCTPGMILAATAICANASESAIREALAGNLCRCTGYASIVRAVRAINEAT